MHTPRTTTIRLPAIPYDDVDDLRNRVARKLDELLGEPQSDYIAGYNDALSVVLVELHNILTAANAGAAGGEVQRSARRPSKLRAVLTRYRILRTILSPVTAYRLAGLQREVAR